jgi:hypothetical protein
MKTLDMMESYEEKVLSVMAEPPSNASDDSLM